MCPSLVFPATAEDDCRTAIESVMVSWMDNRCYGSPPSRLWLFGRRSMRGSVLAVVTLLSVLACSSRDTATPTAASTGPDKPSAPALPVPAVPQTSRWELDPENSSAGFVCKHV